MSVLLQKYGAELVALPPLPVDPANTRMRRLFDQFLRAVDNVVKGESHRQTFVQRNRAIYADFKAEIWRTGIEFVPYYAMSPRPFISVNLQDHDEDFGSKSVPEWEKQSAPQFHKRLGLSEARDVINEFVFSRLL